MTRSEDGALAGAPRGDRRDRRARGRGSASAAGKPIVIGWADRRQGQHGPVRRAGARRRAGRDQADQREGRRQRASAADHHLRHAGYNPQKAKSCAREPDRQGRRHHLQSPATSTTRRRPCRSRSTAGMLTVAPCIGTDQMGPKRFGSKGKLAFTSATPRRTRARRWPSTRGSRGWKTRRRRHRTSCSSTSRTSCKAFNDRFTQLGGKIVAQESLHARRQHVSNVVTPPERREGRRDRDLDVVRRAAGVRLRAPHARQQHADPQLVGRRRHYWWPKSPKVTNYYSVTYASAFGDDPNPAVNALGQEQVQGRHRRLRHRRRRDRRRRDRDQAARRLDQRRGARGADGEVQEVPTISGLVSFSPQLHTVFGRQYRVIEINDNKAQGRRRWSPRRSCRRSSGVVDGTRRTQDAGGPEQRSGPPPSRGRSRACRRSQDVTLELRRHEVVGLIGPNGAGKTTLVNVITGFDLPTAGTVELDGRDVTRWTPHRRGRAGPRAHVPAQPLVPRA